MSFFNTADTVINVTNAQQPNLNFIRVIVCCSKRSLFCVTLISWLSKQTTVSEGLGLPNRK